MKHYDILLTKIFLLVGAATGTLDALKEADLIMGMVLKGVSIISFLVVIGLNLPKLIRMIKIYLK